MMKVSNFGKRIQRKSGISLLMKDLGEAMAGDRNMLMLGGGNPAHIPEVQERFRQSMLEVMAIDGEFERAIGNYDTPQGNKAFIQALVTLLRKEYGWEIGPENVALTTGSQSAFFTMFNMLAGPCPDGVNRKILLPLAPEYIGYADVGLTDDFFLTSRPLIKHIDEHTFKYHVDFNSVEVSDEVGAICVSRPTNPTGNVLTNDEIEHLGRLAAERDIPLILDNAYGTPFPNIIFAKADPVWNEHTVVCMSLSKLGLPSARTGIVVARPEIIEAISEMNGIISLAPSTLGAVLAAPIVRSGEIIAMSRDVIRPHYEKMMRGAVAVLREEFEGLDYHIHKPEGALFLWLWLRDLPISSQVLYERLKQRGVLVVSGHYFFPGLENDNWKHKDECLRINYALDPDVVEKGLKIIADEVREVYTKG